MIRNFQEMLNCLIKGYSFGFHTPELNNLFHKAQINLRWITSSLTLIKKYDPGFRSNMINENQFVDFHNIINSNDKEMFLPQQNDYRNLNMLLAEKHDAIIESPEYKRLYQLKQAAEDWIIRTKKVNLLTPLNYNILNMLTILIDLEQRSFFFPFLIICWPLKLLNQ